MNRARSKKRKRKCSRCKKRICENHAAMTEKKYCCKSRYYCKTSSEWKKLQGQFRAGIQKK